MKKKYTICSRAMVALAVTALLSANLLAQSVRSTEILSSFLGNASSGEVAVVYSTGLVYTAGLSSFGSNIGVVNPMTNQLIKVIRPADPGNAPSVSYSRVSQATSMVYFLRGSRIDVVDGRAASPTFNQLLQPIVFSGQTSFSFAIDEERSRIYAVTTTAGTNPVQAQVHIVDSDPSSKSFHQILATVALPLGVQARNVAVNTVSNKIYVAGGGASGGVFVINGINNELTRITTSNNTSTIAVNEVSNTVYSGFSNSPNIQAIDGVTDTPLTLISVLASSGASLKTIAVNSVSERIYAALTSNSLTVIDAKRSSPTFNTAIVNIPNVGGSSGEVAVHEGLNRIVVASGNSFTTSIIDGNSHSVVAAVKGNMNSTGVAINPITNQAFIGYSLYTTQTVDLNDNSDVSLGTVTDLYEGLVNTNNNSFYFGRSTSESSINFLDQSDTLGTISGLPHGFGRYLFAGQNKTTNRMYFLNSAADLAGTQSRNENHFVAVIDGATNSVLANVEVGPQPFGGIAVNELTNKIYIPHAGFGGAFPSKLMVLDGATNVATDVDTSAFPAGTGFFGVIAANPTTNRIYFQISQGNSFGVIDGSTNVATPLMTVPGTGTLLQSLPINTDLNRLYFLTSSGVRVYDGANHTEIAHIELSSPSSMVMNETTGRLFVRSLADHTLTAIDGKTNTIISTVALPTNSSVSTMAVNETTNEVYVGAITDIHQESTSSILFVNGDTLAVRKSLPIPLRPSRIYVNPSTQSAYVLPFNASQRTGVVVISTAINIWAPFDFDGDGKTDISVYRPGVGEWWSMRSSDGSHYGVQFGQSTDVITPADFTGDGKADFAFWRPSDGHWYVLRSEDFTFYAFPFGTAGDIPMPADYDGDGKADAAVFRPASGMWFVLRSGDGGVDFVQFGLPGDQPVAADYDGDGNADIAIFRPSLGQWWLRRSTEGVLGIQFGNADDKTVPGDYTGDGKADVAFWRPSDGHWYILRSEDFSFYAFPFGLSTDIPAPGDYDGDGKFDAAVFRPETGMWIVNRSTDGILFQQFGQQGDRPLPNAFVR